VVDAPIDYGRLYAYRHQGVRQDQRQAVWNRIAAYVYRLMGNPRVVLDPAAGRGEFISAIPAPERWIVDVVDQVSPARGLNVVLGDVFSVDLPADHFDGVFVSNFLEHLATQAEVARFLKRMRHVMQSGGRLAILGPNFKYCYRSYFDFADHTLALTHVAVDEHLHAAGFEVRSVIPRFIPFSFRSSLPASGLLTGGYLSFPPAWRVFGKQFLFVASKP
jgi:SAM-dependent methyltransferase